MNLCRLFLYRIDDKQLQVEVKNDERYLFWAIRLDALISWRRCLFFRVIIYRAPFRCNLYPLHLKWWYSIKVLEKSHLIHRIYLRNNVINISDDTPERRSKHWRRIPASSQKILQGFNRTTRNGRVNRAENPFISPKSSFTTHSRPISTGNSLWSIPLYGLWLTIISQTTTAHDQTSAFFRFLMSISRRCNSGAM